jgi:mono/diheme cytochrome c family protein
MFVLFGIVGCNSRNYGLSGKDLKKAKVIYTSNCASCHGESGRGDGIASASFNPPPRNFHLPTDKWVNGKSVDGIEKTLREGIQPNMWKYSGKDEDIPLLARYVFLLGSTDAYVIEVKDK